MKQIHLTLILLCILFSFPAVAEQELIKPQTQGEVTFVSGGVGTDEQNALQAMRTGYNLHLLFSIKGTGEYVSDVRVRIADSRGNSLMETLSDGPILFARLKPGRYIITVQRGGQAFKQKATVESTKWASLSFAWPQERAD